MDNRAVSIFSLSRLIEARVSAFGASASMLNKKKQFFEMHWIAFYFDMNKVQGNKLMDRIKHELSNL